MNPSVEAKLGRGLGFLMDCLGEDLRSGQPSREDAYLKSVLDGLYQVELLGNAHRQIRDLLEKFYTNYSQEVRVAPEEVMRSLLAASQSDIVTEREILEIVDAVHIPPLEATVHFLTQLTEIVRQFPLKLYPDLNCRARLLEALQRALDSVISVESAWR